MLYLCFRLYNINTGQAEKSEPLNATTQIVPVDRPGISLDLLFQGSHLTVPLGSLSKEDFVYKVSSQCLCFNWFIVIVTINIIFEDNMRRNNISPASTTIIMKIFRYFQFESPHLSSEVQWCHVHLAKDFFRTCGKLHPTQCTVR